MRTTLINTTFWRESEVDHLHLDSKLFYLFLLTNPDKGLANIYHHKPKVFSAYCGLSVEQIEVATKQLAELGYIDTYNGYYILLKGHERPKTGRFTEKTMQKELELVPTEVIDHFNNLNSSGVAPEHKDNNKDNNKDIVISNNKEVDKANTANINELFDKWAEIVGYEITSKTQNNRTAVSKLMKLRKKEEIISMMRGVAMSQEDRYAPRISNFIDLNNKWDELIAWGKRNAKNGTGKVAII